MLRIAILDHDKRKLFVEEINDDLLNKVYGDNIERYIKYNHSIANYSWEYISRAIYVNENNTSIDIHFEDIADKIDADYVDDMS